jgi:hypothetical protein
LCDVLSQRRSREPWMARGQMINKRSKHFQVFF